jgi:hypothetical protein
MHWIDMQHTTMRLTAITHALSMLVILKKFTADPISYGKA